MLRPFVSERVQCPFSFFCFPPRRLLTVHVIAGIAILCLRDSNYASGQASGFQLCLRGKPRDSNYALEASLGIPTMPWWKRLQHRSDCGQVDWLAAVSISVSIVLLFLLSPPTMAHTTSPAPSRNSVASVLGLRGCLLASTPNPKYVGCFTLQAGGT